MDITNGVSIELAQWRKQTLDSLVYDLHFTIPEEVDNYIPARLKLSVTISDLSQSLQLDFQADAEQIRQLAANGQKVPVRLEQEHLIVPANFLVDGQNDITIDFIAGDLSLNRKPDFLYTLLVPDRARTLFPCIDQPNLKAKYKLTLDIPQDWDALANGSLKEVKEENGRKRMQFRATAPISTYLFAFTAGRFQRATATRYGQKMSMLYRESDADKVNRNIDEIFDLHGTALEWMKQYTAIPLPFEKFDFALLPGFQYGGMEHVGAIFYRESSLMLDENATQNQRIGRASLIAHETTHMWFGDLVTMEWFDDVWLKEVFANFMAAKIVNPSFPEINHDLNFLLRHQPAAYGEDRSGGTHPIQQQLDNLNEAGTLYGRIIYQKAPVVMRMLEEKMGADGLREGLRVYLREFAYGNASWDDLIKILDDRSEDDLRAWSTAWVKRAGMPTFIPQATAMDNGRELRIRYLPGPNDTIFREQQLTPAAFYPDSIMRTTVALTATQKKANYIQVPGQPLAILSHASPAAYGYFPLDEESRQWFLKNIGDIDDPVLRGGVWLSLYEDFLRGELELNVFYASLLEQISQEKNALLRNYLLQRIEEVYWRFYTPEERDEYTAELEDRLRQAYQAAADPGAVMAYFRTYYAIAQSDLAMKELRKVWESEQIRPAVPLTEGESIDLVVEMALRLGSEADPLLQAQLQRTKNEDRRQRLNYIIPALSADQSVRDHFFAGLKNAENRATEPWTVDAVAYLHHPLRAKTALPYIMPSLELMEEIQATGDIFFPRQFITATLSGHQSAEAAATVRDFLDERPDYPKRLRNKILMGADLLFRSVRVR